MQAQGKKYSTRTSTVPTVAGSSDRRHRYDCSDLLVPTVQYSYQHDGGSDFIVSLYVSDFPNVTNGVLVPTIMCNFNINYK